MRFRRKLKTRYLAEGNVAAIAETLIPLAPLRVIYGDGTDKNDTVFVIESGDGKFQVIGTYDHLIQLSSAIDEELFTWIYNNDRTDWFGYSKPNRQERDAGNGRQDI